MNREIPVRFCEGGGVRFPSATRLVVLAKHVGTRISRFIEETLEGWLGLAINRDKTRVVKLGEEGSHLDFLGFTLRYECGRRPPHRRYLSLTPSRKALQRERAVLREKTGPQTGWKAIPDLIAEMNAHLRGWANYFRLGQPRRAFWQINRYVRARLAVHLRRRSQRPLRPAEGETIYGLLAREGLVSL